MTRAEKSIESRIKEHKKFREQCRRRKGPIGYLILAIPLVWAIFTWDGLPIAPSIFLLILIYFYSQEVIGYKFHSKKLKELGYED